MSDFFKSPFVSKSSSSSSSPSGATSTRFARTLLTDLPLDGEKKEQLMNIVRTEIAQANAQMLMNASNMNERCFKACVTRPGASLNSSEETCLTRCMERFMDTCMDVQSDLPLRNLTNFNLIVNIVSRTYTARLSRERLDSITSDFEKLP
ncbi:uncharacterized protein BT62DRAFT_960550 [Guyanagaster necrorhizus]|uniref:Mitochondrial import inner membrane translocase subunit n=1 Tax=Guyanagaster necrorhizus TaxID=856835 RepID=A0A9P7W2S6_9AGAR|nr:uncharacterized protein BT62DRAFT_960550 [Guyanagaster necrorhizus MCA 3950]KAG7450989.1 hypothetical protein BT62DRAFT_960550 [Guyanagaster necrorhizus MCA 3950]